MLAMGYERYNMLPMVLIQYARSQYALKTGKKQEGIGMFYNPSKYDYKYGLSTFTMSIDCNVRHRVSLH